MRCDGPGVNRGRAAVASVVASLGDVHRVSDRVSESLVHVHRLVHGWLTRRIRRCNIDDAELIS
jgi:hypothetical protein